MVEGVSIFRPQTTGEKADYIEVGTKTNMDKFLNKLSTIQQKYMKEYKPFCLRCAKLDFEKKAEEIKTEAQMTGMTSQVEAFDVANLEKYGDKERFELVDVRDVREDKLLDGIRNTVIVGKEYVFKCKIRGCGYKMFVVREEVAKVDEYFGITKKQEVKATKA